MSYVPEIWDGQLTMTKISLLENQQKAATNPPTRWKDGQRKLTDWHRSLMARHTIEWGSPPIWSIYWGNPSWYLTIQLIWKIESGNQGFRPQALHRAIKHNFFLIHVIIKMEKTRISVTNQDEIISWGISDNFCKRLNPLVKYEVIQL